MREVKVELKPKSGDEENANPPVFVSVAEGGEKEGEKENVSERKTNNSTKINPCSASEKFSVIIASHARQKQSYQKTDNKN